MKRNCVPWKIKLLDGPCKGQVVYDKPRGETVSVWCRNGKQAGFSARYEIAQIDTQRHIAVAKYAG